MFNTWCLCCRVPEGNAQAAGEDDRAGRLLQQHLRLHAHVLPVPQYHPDRAVRAQPQRVHQQRQLLLTPVGAGP